MTVPSRIQAVISDVAGRHRLDPAELLGPARRARISHARQEAMALCRALTPRPSLPQIGHWFGGRHHTTVLHALDAVQRRGALQSPPRAHSATRAVTEGP